MSLEKLEEQLNCSICLESYTDPRLLQCHHVYCKACLAKLVDKDEHEQFIVLCPECRTITPIPAGGVASLQSDFRANQLLDIVKEHKKQVAAMENQSASLIEASLLCPEHSGRKVELYCETCMELICLKCSLRGEKHHNHNYEVLEKDLAGEFPSILEPLEEHLTILDRAMTQVDLRCIEMSNQQKIIKADIHTVVKQLHETLDARKNELIDQLDRITQAKLKSLKTQKEEMEKTQSRLDSCLQFMKDKLRACDKRELLLTRRTTLKQVKELVTSFQPNFLLQPNCEADVKFTMAKEFKEMCEAYGYVAALSSPDPPKCYATGKGVLSAVVGEKSSAVLQMVNCNGDPSRELTSSIQCEVVSEITGTRVRGSMKRRGQCQYDLSYKPTVKGRHQLHILVENQHIRGSPFPLIITLPLEGLGTPILAIEGVERPDGVAITHGGDVVVSEGGVDRVSVFTPCGEKLRSFCKSGSSEGEIISPYQVAVDGEGNILVTDRWNYRVQKFTVEGKFLAEVGTKGHGPLQFDCPYGIAYNPVNDKVYVGDGGGYIQILNVDLSYFGTFGKKGQDRGDFDNPRHIACDSAGNVYVADCHNHRIQVFTAEGQFLRMFGRRGAGRGELDMPCGVAVDTEGVVYVSEWNNNRISVFDREGKFVTYFGTRGEGPGKFNGPRGLIVDSSGVVYVCDFFNRHVHVF